MMTTVRVKGMTCTKCTAAVRQALESVHGVEEAAPDLSTGIVVVVGQNLVRNEMIEAIEAAGYRVVD